MAKSFIGLQLDTHYVNRVFMVFIRLTSKNVSQYFKFQLSIVYEDFTLSYGANKKNK